MEQTETIRKVKLALLSMQRYSWDQGVTAHAFWDLGETETVVALAKSAVYRQIEDGRTAIMGGFDAVTDPCTPGEAIVEAYQVTGDPIFKQALDRLLDWALHKAPRTEDGVVCHVQHVHQVWADSTYMLPPFLTAAGYEREAVEQMEGYWKLLSDPETKLFHHIWNDETKSFDRGDFWGGGTGWAVAAMARMLHRISEEHGDLRERLLAMELPLIESLQNVIGENGFAHDILNDSSSFVEVNFSQMYAYAIFTGIADGWLSETYLPLAEKMRKAANSKVDQDGFVQQVCAAPDFCRPGTSPEGQAFYLLMEAAAQRLEAGK